MGTAAVSLKVYGSDFDDVITLCPDDNYTLAFECLVSGSFFFEWELEPLFNATAFEQSLRLGKHPQSHVTIVLIDKETTSFQSQFLVSTSVLIDELHHRNNQLEVVYTGFSSSKSKVIRISGI